MTTTSDSQWPADHVGRRPVSKLVPYARNARTHDAAQVAQIAKSIRKWGWTIPILVDERDGIIAGHGRVLAAAELKLTDIPVMVARGWSEAKKRAYVLADNRLALDAGWDNDILRIELAALCEADFDLSLTGFNADEIAAALAEQVAVPAPPRPAHSDTSQTTHSCPSCGYRWADDDD